MMTSRFAATLEACHFLFFFSKTCPFKDLITFFLAYVRHVLFYDKVKAELLLLFFSSLQRPAATSVPRRRRLPHELPSLPSQLVVEVRDLPQESVVWPDVPVPADLRQRLHGRHVLPEHEVGENARAGAGHAHQAVDQNFA